MNRWAKKQTGFTIVELLIVVVVIAILAAITIVAYNGIQNRTHDSSVQSDMKNIATKVNNYKTLNASDQFPTTLADMTSLSISVSRSSYITNNNNLLYCRSTDGKSWALVALSKSGKVYAVGSERPAVAEYSGAGVSSTAVGSQVDVCPGVMSTGVTTSNVWGYTGGAWQSWVQ